MDWSQCVDFIFGWATRGGLIKTNWSQGPFVASFMNYNADNACIWSIDNGTTTSTSPCSSGGSSSSSSSSSTSEWFSQRGIDPPSKKVLRWVQRKFMVYNYCTDKKRFSQDVDVIDDEEIDFARTSHMLRGTWLSSNHDIFHYGLPTPLLNYLRRAHGLVHHSETDLWKNLEVEIGVLENLRSTFEDMMQNLGDEEDSIDTDWDVQMAMKFKEKQRKIVSSILDLCSAGIKLVQDAMV